MYAYLQRVVYPHAIEAYNDIGEFGIDIVVIDYMLKAEFAKGFRINKAEKEEVYLLDKKHMKKERLHKYICDVINHLEINMNHRVPDSQEYKDMLSTGRHFKQV